MLAMLLIHVGLAQSVAAGTNPEKEAKFAEKVKAGIAKLGTGTEARVEVKLKDKRKLKGYVSEAGTDSFTIVDEKTGEATKVAYSNAKQVKGNNLSKGVGVAIAIGILVVAIILVATVFGGN
jgi:hypothetical protein